MLLADRAEDAEDPWVDRTGLDVDHLELIRELDVLPVDRRVRRARQGDGVGTVFTWQLPAIDSASCSTASTYHSAWLCTKSPARRSPAAQIIRASVAPESAGLSRLILPSASPLTAYCFQWSAVMPSGPTEEELLAAHPLAEVRLDPSDGGQRPDASLPRS